MLSQLLLVLRNLPRQDATKDLRVQGLDSPTENRRVASHFFDGDNRHTVFFQVLSRAAGRNDFKTETNKVPSDYFDVRFI